MAMLQVLLISNEIGPDNPGVVSNAAQFGLDPDLQNIPNLIKTMGSLIPCDVHVVHHTQLQNISSLEFDCVVLSGFFPGHGFSDKELKKEFSDELRFIQSCTKPILGICLGIQLIGLAYGSSTAPMKNGIGEHGFISLRQELPHPILDGFEPEKMPVLVLHGRELTAIPSGFDLLLSGQQCHIQMIASKNRPLYGVQFHPEIGMDKKNIPYTLLQNFLMKASRD